MPEAPMNKDNFSTGWEDEIRLTRQIADVKAIPVAHPVRHLSHGHLRLHARAANPSHDFASPFFGDFVHRKLNFQDGCRDLN